MTGVLTVDGRRFRLQDYLFGKKQKPHMAHAYNAKYSALRIETDVAHG